MPVHRAAPVRTGMGRPDRGLSHPSTKPGKIAELRRRIAGLEGRLPFETQLGPALAPAASGQGPDTSPKAPAKKTEPGLGVLENLMRGAVFSKPALHEVVSAQSRNSGALTGFAMGVIARLMKNRSGSVLWCLDPQVGREAGQPYGPGLMRFGIDPSRLILVRPRRAEELLWAMEEGARCPALAAVVGEVQGALKLLDLTATRRLMLRAQAGGVPVFLVRHGVVGEPTAAATRWCVAPHVSAVPPLSPQGPHDGLGQPVWVVDLNRNRTGREGRLTVEWTYAAREFAAPARSLPLVPGAGLRPDSASLAPGRALSGKGS
ncbi:ImuA family protein [Roseibium sp. RKSG952]|uniref:ImuA family protein n=1 Tax=Roseibium sp. RKSG952 TaxID=2529384 RepID=UPI0012BBFD99|nr:inducible mutagenesis protein A [Roseibium sp. RKSG952]MTH98085.1 inducible mutagenesis protein A [Roseibium sp. RKSG952]